MPRRRPGALRAALPAHRPAPAWARDLGPVDDRLSAGTTAAIHFAEHTPRHVDIAPGVTARMLARYRAFVRAPGGRAALEPSSCPACPGCRYDDIAECRDTLEEVVAVLPPAAAGELRRLLDRLDARFRSRTFPDPLSWSSPWRADPRRWWLRRLYEGGG